MPVANAIAALPRAFHDFVWRTALYVPNECILLWVFENLTEHDSLVLTLVGGHAVVVLMCGDFQAGIADGIEWKYGDIEIDEVGVVAVDGIERAIVEIGDVLLRWQAGSAAPSPLAMNRIIVPRVIAKIVVLGIESLWVESFPPFLRTIDIGLVAIFLREPAIVFHTSLLALEVEAT